MHEIGIADSILQAVRAEAQRYPNGHPVKVGVRIGELAGVDPDALDFCFESLIRGTDLASLKLEIQFCPRIHFCPACESEFSVSNYDFLCPQCGRDDTEFKSGDQLEFASLEIEEYEPNTA
jgi:hydrogenase nickel incorporation protein HypA/HybF